MTALAAYLAALDMHRMGDSQPSSVVSPASDMSGVPGSSAGGTDALCDAHTGQIQGGHCSSAVRGVWRCAVVARRGAWRVARGVASAGFWVGLRRGAGLTLKMKTRVGARLLVAPRGATCWYGSTHASESYGVRFSSTNHMNFIA